MKNKVSKQGRKVKEPLREGEDRLGVPYGPIKNIVEKG